MTPRTPPEESAAPLCLDFTRCDQGMRVGFFEETSQRWTPRGFELVQIEFDEVDRICEDLKFLLERANIFGEIGSAAASEIERLALLLFDELIPPRLKPLLRRRSGAMTLRLDESLQHIPWELLHTGEQFIARQFALSRQVMLYGIHDPPPVRELEGRRRVLILSDPRADLPASAREGLLLREAFTLRADVELGYKGAPIRRSDLRENLREYDVLHFAGHAEWDESGGGWLLDDGRFEPRDIQRLAGSRALPSLVFANACASASAPRPMHSHMARSFIAAGVRHVIGTLWDIPDAIGVLFAHSFYEHLLRGVSIGEAMRRTRVEMAELYGEGTVLWGSYVLYGPPDIEYFSASPSTDAVQAAPSVDRSLLALAALPVDPRSPIAPNPTLRSSAVALPSVIVEATQPTNRVGRAAFRGAILAGLLAALCWWAVTPPGLEPPTTTTPAAPAPADAPREAASSSVAASGATLEVVARTRQTDGWGPAEALLNGDALHMNAPFQLRFKVNQDAYSAVLYLRADGHVQQLFPSVAGDYGEVTSDVEVRLPERNQWYWSDATPGLAAIVLITTPQPLEALPQLANDLVELTRSAAPRFVAAPERCEGTPPRCVSEADLRAQRGGGLQTIPVEALRSRLQREGARVEIFEVNHRP